MGEERRPRVSIGMPVFDGAAYLRRALDSLLAQSFGDFELLASDNASSDGTWKILQEYAARDRRLLLFRQPHNLGIGANFHFVLQRAQGEYFMWAAHDDFWSPGYLEELLACLERYPVCALAAAKIAYLEPGGREYLRVDFPEPLSDSRFRRLRQSLRGGQAGWVYGLFRTGELRRVYESLVLPSGMVWAGDHLIILHFLLGDRIRGANGATFYETMTPTSRLLYKPKGAMPNLRFTLNVLRRTLSILVASPLPLLHKLALLPSFFCYLDRRIFKLWSAFKRLIFWPFARS